MIPLFIHTLHPTHTPHTLALALQEEQRSLCAKRPRNSWSRWGLRRRQVGWDVRIRYPGEGGTQRGRESDEAGKGRHQRCSGVLPGGQEASKESA